MKTRLVLLGLIAALAVGLTAPAFGSSNVVSSSAVAAKTTAQKALAKAIKADKHAKAAQSKAKAAQSTADAAGSAAAAAQAAADNALSVANSKYGSVNYFSDNTAENQSTPKSVTITCDVPSQVVGGGYALTGGVNAAYVTVNAPYGDVAWIVSAVDNPDVNSNWRIDAGANCIS